MRILIFSWRDPKHPLAGGAEKVIHEHSKGWIKAGHKVTLFSSRFPKSRKKEVLDGVTIIREGSQYLGVQFKAFLFYRKNEKLYDLVIDQFHGLPFFTPLYVKKPKFAVIQETAKEVWFLNPFVFPLNLFVGALGYILEPFFFRIYRNTRFMTGSNSAKEDLIREKINEKYITVINHGLSTVKMTKQIRKEKDKTIIFLGRLARDKGIEDALEVFKILYRNNNDYIFWVVGAGETKSYEDKIKKKAASMFYKNNIRFFGRVNERKKFELLGKSHILINPSKREGWGLVNIEANSVHTPVVAYNSAGLIDSVKDNYSGLISNKKSPEDLAKKIIALLGNSRKYHQIMNKSYTWSKNFSWKNSVKQSLALMKKVSNFA